MIPGDNIINEYGQLVPLMGNEYSPSHIKAQFPGTFSELCRAVAHLRRDPSNELRYCFDTAFRTLMPLAEYRVKEMFWRTLQCERDISNFLNKQSNTNT